MRRWTLRRGVVGLCAAGLWLGPGETRGDSWPPPAKKVYFSSNGAYRFTVLPRERAGGVTGPTGKQAGCRGELARRQAASGDYRNVWSGPLVNEVSPVLAAVSDDGASVATFDNWLTLGYGPQAVVLYGPAGELVRSYSLLDVLTPQEIAALGRTVSSLPWLNGAEFDHRDGRSLLRLRVRSGPDGEDDVAVDVAPGRPLRASSDLDRIEDQKKRCRSFREGLGGFDLSACMRDVKSIEWCRLCGSLAGRPGR